MVERQYVSDSLNDLIVGFAEGTMNGLKRTVVDMFKHKYGLDIPLESVTIIDDLLHKPDRYCWSIHVDFEGKHYESVMVNLNYAIHEE